jgi:ribosomal protein S18 acetylase RimI-like enzyme
LPDQRGQQIGWRLLWASLDHVRSLDGFTMVVLAVTAGNNAARSLYRRAGFVTWGVQPEFIRVGDVYHDIEWMILWL